MSDLREDDAELGRETLTDDDLELAEFFSGRDMTRPPVADGGKPGVCEDCDG